MRTQLRQQQIKRRRQVMMVQGYTDLNACTSWGHRSSSHGLYAKKQNKDDM